ncbi:MAG TPA: hypothetical protein PLU94_08225 [Methanoregulaceae archaeon]|nr:hypothetical protein [Methanoregulaceae archaeon]HPM61692.1 hypothetical protein [Methanoregulaceae archaeon]
MVSASLHSAMALLRSPAAWLPGLALGSIAAVFLITQYYYGLFIAERLLVILLVMMPLFMAGVLSMVKSGDSGFHSFLSGGLAGYFRILLPSLLVLFAIIITIMLVLIPLIALGFGGTALIFSVLICTLSILFFTLFYDAAAVLEGRTVFDSIRRSVEFVIRNTHSCIVFYLTSLVIGGVIWFVTLLAWTAALYERLVSISTMTPDEIQAFTPDQFNALLGQDGILITALIFFAGIALVFSLLYLFKAYFFRDYTGSGEGEPRLQGEQGEYDSKGRWYKY